MLRLKKLDSTGFGHNFLLPILVISLIAAAGSYYIVRSNAETPANTATYRTASYNVLGAGAIAAPGFNKAHNTNTFERMKYASKVIREFDIVGVQELDYYKEDRFNKNQFTMFKDELSNAYGIHPQNSPSSQNKALKFDKASMRAIFWKKDKFNVVDRGEIAYPYQDAPRKANGEFEKNDNAPWVLLQDKNNPSVKFYVLNTHLIAYNTKGCRWNCNPPNERGGSDQYGDQKRKAAAEIFGDWVAEKKKKYPVLMTGDFNSGVQIKHRDSPVERAGLPYCVLTEKRGDNQILRNTMDAHYGRHGKCPTTNNNKYFFIDHIYTTQSFKVDNWFKMSNKDTNRASDHRPTVAVVSLTLPANAGANGGTEPPASVTTEKETGEYTDGPVVTEQDSYSPDESSLVED